jgi:hypothetical protein
MAAPAPAKLDVVVIDYEDLKGETTEALRGKIAEVRRGRVGLAVRAGQGFCTRAVTMRAGGRAAVGVSHRR